MRASNINGSVSLTGVERSNKSLVLKFDGVYAWSEEKRLYAYSEGTEERIDVSGLDKSLDYCIKCWSRRGNSRRNAVRIEIDKDELFKGKIVIPDIFSLFEIFEKVRNSSDVYFVLFGSEERTEQPEAEFDDSNDNIRHINYILGSSQTLEAFEEGDGVFASGVVTDRRMFLLRNFIEGGDGFWTLCLASPEEYIKSLKLRDEFDGVMLSVSAPQWRGESLCLSLSGEKPSSLENIESFYIYDKGKAALYQGAASYQGESGEIILSPDLVSIMANLYYTHSKMSRVKLFILTEKGGRHTCFEFRSEAQYSGKDNKYGKNTERYAQYFTYQAVEEDDRDLAIMPYFSSNGYLKLLVKPKETVFNELATAKVRKIKLDGSVLRIRMSLIKTDYEIKEIAMVLRSKVTEKKHRFDLDISDKGDRLVIDASLNLEEVDWEQFYWDIKGVVEKDGAEYELRIRNYSKIMKLKMLLKNYQYRLSDGEHVVYPYMSKSRGFAVMYRVATENDSRAFVMKEYLAIFLYYLLRPFWLSKNIWLVYEKYSITAQDNSLYFFRYCMEKLPKKEKKHIYYVIDKNSSDYAYVEQYGKRVISFLSLKHMIYLKAAKLLISSDTKAHSYAWHSPASLYREMIGRNRHVFLQHGVIYFKKCHEGLRKSGTNGTNLFIVSSEIEKSIIKEYFGYNSNEIAVTGLSRWDVLHDTSAPGEKLILIMPTWRNWLEEATLDTFRESDYYKNYMALLNAPALHKFLEEKNVKLVFYIHPKFREYISSFATSSPFIEMIEFGSRPLNELIMKCNMMITDYSSACWDVYYQGKPVLFYIFDFRLYDRVQGSYIDMRTESFGDVTDNLDGLIELMKKYEAGGFKEEEKYALMRNELLPYRDNDNSQRTYEAILKKFYPKKYKKLMKAKEESSDAK